MKKKLLLCLLLTISFNGYSQLKIDAYGKLSLGNIVPVSSFKAAYEGWGHFYNYNGGCSMKIILGAADPRISGSRGCIVFYDNGHQDIQVRNVYNMSDARAKTNITNLNNSTQTILQLKPKTYSFISEPQTFKSTSKEIGFLAQEVESVLPEAVMTDDEGNKLINYTAIIPILTGSIHELNARIAVLEREISILKSK